MAKLLIPKGTKFGRLTVLKEVDPYVSPKGQTQRRFKLKCKCKGTIVTYLSSLRGGSCKSCGCLRLEVSRKSKPKEQTESIPTPSKQELRRLFDYNPKTGDLIWKWRNDKGNHINARWSGKVAGLIVKREYGIQYKVIGIDGILYLAHRLVWAWHHADPGENEIDHEDGCGINNRIRNLRLVNRVGNMKNVKRHSTNKTGITGVHYNPRCKKSWSAVGHFTVEGKEKQVTIGSFNTKSAARIARKQWERANGYHKNHGR